MDPSDWGVPPPGRKNMSYASVIPPIPTAGGNRRNPEDYVNRPSTSATGNSHPSPGRKQSRSAYQESWQNQNAKPKKKEQYKDIIPPIPSEEFDDGLNYNAAVACVAIPPADEEGNCRRRSQQCQERLKNTRIYEEPQLPFLKSNSKAQLIGIGDRGLVLIRLDDVRTVIQFEKHEESMNNFYNAGDNAGGKLRMPRDEIDIGRIVIVLWGYKRYIRGRVLHVRDEDDHVLVRDLDTWDSKYVPTDCVFYVVPQCLQSPLMVVTVKLKYLEFWDGSPVLMDMIPIIPVAFKEAIEIKKCEKDDDGLYSVLIEVTLKSRTYNQLAIDDEHITLNVLLVQVIAGFTRVPTPKDICRGFIASECHVSIVEGNGEVWIQMHSYLSHKLTSLGELPFKTENNSLDEENWTINALSHRQVILNFHDAYFDRGDRVFLARFLEDRSFYRVKILFPLLEGDEEAVVQYLDFGNTETIPIADILPVDCFDPILSKIPMQVFRGYLNGIDSVDDIDEFFEAVDIHTPQKVMISGFKDPGRIPLLDVFIQNKEDKEFTHVNQMLIDKKIAKGLQKITPIIPSNLRQAPGAPKTVGTRKNKNKSGDGVLKRFYAGCRIIEHRNYVYVYDPETTDPELVDSIKGVKYF